MRLRDRSLRAAAQSRGCVHARRRAQRTWKCVTPCKRRAQNAGEAQQTEFEAPTRSFPIYSRLRLIRPRLIRPFASLERISKVPAGNRGDVVHEVFSFSCLRLHMFSHYALCVSIDLNLRAIILFQTHAGNKTLRMHKHNDCELVHV